MNNDRRFYYDNFALKLLALRATSTRPPTCYRRLLSSVLCVIACAQPRHARPRPASRLIRSVRPQRHGTTATVLGCIGSVIAMPSWWSVASASGRDTGAGPVQPTCHNAQSAALGLLIVVCHRCTEAERAQFLALSAT